MSEQNKRVAWVVGGGSGMGLAGALALSQAGIHVVISGRRKDALEDAAAHIRQAGGNCSVEVLDITDPDAVMAVASRIETTHGRLDVLVNCAGMNVADRFWNKVSAADWKRVIDTNLNGNVYCIQAVLPLMRKQKDGLIINVSSWAARYPLYLAGPAYTASKHGLLALNESINMEEGFNGIRATALCPGEVVTPLLDKRPVPVPEHEKARMVQPEDVGRTILFIVETPKHVCLNEIVVSPSWNRLYAGGADLSPKSGN